MDMRPGGLENNSGAKKNATEIDALLKSGALTPKQILLELDNNPRITIFERDALRSRLAVEAIDKLADSDDKVRDLEERLALDNKTMLMNDTFLESTLKGYLQRLNFEGEGDAGSDLEAVMVLYFDIDNFTEFNTKYGHELGDQALKAVAQRMKDVMRSGDPMFLNTLFRKGGDEFLAIVPIAKSENQTSDLEAIFKRIKEQLNTDLFFDVPDPENEGSVIRVPITVSVGKIISRKDDDTSVGGLISGADKQMYVEKRKNKVVIEGEDRRK